MSAAAVCRRAVRGRCWLMGHFRVYFVIIFTLKRDACALDRTVCSLKDCSSKEPAGTWEMHVLLRRNQCSLSAQYQRSTSSPLKPSVEAREVYTVGQIDRHTQWDRQTDGQTDWQTLGRWYCTGKSGEGLGWAIVSVQTRWMSSKYRKNTVVIRPLTRHWKTYSNMSTIVTSSILSKKLIFIINCSICYIYILS